MSFAASKEVFSMETVNDDLFANEARDGEQALRVCLPRPDESQPQETSEASETSETQTVGQIDGQSESFIVDAGLTERKIHVMRPRSLDYLNASTAELKASADLIIDCGGELFYMHRFVVCPQSWWFQRACSGTGQGCREFLFTCASILELLAFKMVVYHLYYATLKPHPNATTTSMPLTLILLSTIAAIADTYQMYSMFPSIAIEQQEALARCLEHARELTGVELGEIELLLRDIYIVRQRFFSFTHRAAVVKMIGNHLIELSQESGFHRLLARLPEFSADLVMHLSRQVQQWTLAAETEEVEETSEMSVDEVADTTWYNDGKMEGVMNWLNNNEV